jgi:hypothetical protein
MGSDPIAKKRFLSSVAPWVYLKQKKLCLFQFVAVVLELAAMGSRLLLAVVQE